MQPKVFVPQVPSSLDKATGIWVPKITLSKASNFGEVKVLLPPGVNRAAIGQLAIAMRENLKEARPGDYLLPTGDPALIAIASVYMARLTGGKLLLLKWDNHNSDYTPMEIDL